MREDLGYLGAIREGLLLPVVLKALALGERRKPVARKRRKPVVLKALALGERRKPVLKALALDEIGSNT